MGGALEGLQNRLPLTWSNHVDKVRNITGWTVSTDSPQGDPHMAGAILDFWCSDWAALSVQMQSSSKGLRPALFERPVLRFGQTLIQLPWQVGLQNNSTAAINNLRRLGQRRGEVLAESRRIEGGLAQALASRGFAVVANWMPDRAVHGDAGEVDVVCARDGIVLVIEVKSTFLRVSPREAYQHATTTLRRAGAQVRRKVDAVTRELLVNDQFQHALRLAASVGVPAVHGWIVDTSIECDHQRFSGFLKVSLEEVLIALRDDVALLHDPGNLSGRDAELKPGEADRRVANRALYAEGFTAQRFVSVIERAEVWREI